MFKKGVVALFIIVAISAIIIGAFAISNNKNSSNGITSNQLTPLNTPLNNTSAVNSNVKPANTNNSIPTVNSPVNNGKTANGNINTADTGNTANSVVSHNKINPESDSVGSTSKHDTTYHLSSVTLISPAKAQEIAAQYIEQAGATPGTPDLITQDGKKVYVVPVMLNNANVGEIDIDAQDGSNLGGAGGVKN